MNKNNVSSRSNSADSPILGLPIDILELSQRVTNILKRSEITTVGVLLEHSKKDLLRLRNFGELGYDELVTALQSKGLPVPEEDGSSYREISVSSETADDDSAEMHRGTEEGPKNDINTTLGDGTEHYKTDQDSMFRGEYSSRWPWNSGDARRQKLFERDHFLTLAQETAVELKAARLRSKMTIADIEALTFVNAQLIESIEQGQWDRLPARVYSRGATFSYANAVGLADPDTHANNISNALNRPEHLSPSSGLMKKRSKNVQQLRIEVISLAALIILVVGSIVWFQNNYSIIELLNLDNTNDQTSNVIDLTFPIVLSVMHPRALRSKHMYTQGYEYKRR